VNVLMTHLHLDYPGGSETSTYTVVAALIRHGHRVTVLTPIRGLMAEHIVGLGARVVDDIRRMDGQPEVLHCQHNVLALLARGWFNGVPLVYQSHGTQPLPEQPPSVDLNVQRYLAVSDLVKRHLQGRGVAIEAIRVLENPIDLGRFAPRSSIADRPRRALILSARMDPRTRGVIEEACRRLGIEVVVCGLEGRVFAVEDEIDRADIVFSLGRGALEAMACGRAVYVYDVHGADGWVSPETVDDISSHTFSGKRFHRRPGVEELAEDLARYDPAMGRDNRTIAEGRYDIERYLPRLLELYREAAEAFMPRSLVLPVQEVEVAIAALGARSAELSAGISRAREPRDAAPRSEACPGYRRGCGQPSEPESG
jgi:glycosyltransferase involved in cell wall biosynthesis